MRFLILFIILIIFIAILLYLITPLTNYVERLANINLNKFYFQGYIIIFAIMCFNQHSIFMNVPNKKMQFTYLTITQI